MKPDQCRLQACLLETVPTLCKNGLIYHKRIKIQGLLGITVDDGDVILIQYNDILECSAGLNAFNEEFHETISDKQHELSRFLWATCPVYNIVTIVRISHRSR